MSSTNPHGKRSFPSPLLGKGFNKHNIKTRIVDKNCLLILIVSFFLMIIGFCVFVIGPIFFAVILLYGGVRAAITSYRKMNITR